MTADAAVMCKPRGVEEGETEIKREKVGEGRRWAARISQKPQQSGAQAGSKLLAPLIPTFLVVGSIKSINLHLPTQQKYLDNNKFLLYYS